MKLLREQTGLSLADAVTIVEKIASRSKSGRPRQQDRSRKRDGAEGTVRRASDTSPSTAPVDLDTELEVRSLVADGDKVDGDLAGARPDGLEPVHGQEYVDGLVTAERDAHAADNSGAGRSACSNSLTIDRTTVRAG